MLYDITKCHNSLLIYRFNDGAKSDISQNIRWHNCYSHDHIFPVPKPTCNTSGKTIYCGLFSSGHPLIATKPQQVIVPTFRKWSAYWLFTYIQEKHFLFRLEK